MTYTLSDLLPQKPPMQLLTGYEPASFDGKHLTAFVTITKDDLFFDETLDGTPPTTALEYMAQAIACFVGLNDRTAGKEPGIGFILGTRKLSCSISAFRTGVRYDILCTLLFTDENFGSFECEMREGTSMVATAIINVFRPDESSPLSKEDLP